MLHLGQEAFRFAYGRTQKTFHFHDFGISGRVNDSQNQLFYLWEPQDASNTSRKKKSFKNKWCFWKSQDFGNRQFLNFSKRRAPKKNDDPFNKVLKILNMGSVSSRKHEMDIW